MAYKGATRPTAKPKPKTASIQTPSVASVSGGYKTPASARPKTLSKPGSYDANQAMAAAIRNDPAAMERLRQHFAGFAPAQQLVESQQEQQSAPAEEVPRKKTIADMPFDPLIEGEVAKISAERAESDSRIRARQMTTRSRYGADVQQDGSYKLNFVNPADPYSRTAELRKQYDNARLQTTGNQWSAGIARDGAAMAQDYVLGDQRARAVTRLSEEFADSETGTAEQLLTNTQTAGARIDELRRQAIQQFLNSP